MAKQHGFVRGLSKGVPDGKKETCIVRQTGGLYSIYKLRFDKFHYGQLSRTVMYLGGTAGQSDVLDLYHGENFTITATMGVQAKHIQVYKLDSYLQAEWPKWPDGRLITPRHDISRETFSQQIIKAAVSRAMKKREAAHFFVVRKEAS